MILILIGENERDMKRFALYLGLATALVVSCSTQEKDFQTPVQDDVVFYASFEQPSEGTRVYANEDLLLRWTADDRVSIFNKLTYNQQYKFTGDTGDNAGGFRKVDTDEFVTGNPISHVVSVYPYQDGTKITESEALTVTLPAEQHYAENTFGLGDNTMISVSADNVLQYKNVGGYLMLKLYGEGVSVSSITLKGNNGEKLAGKATVTMPLDGMPTVTLAEDAMDQISLVCDSPVALGATAEESKDFWLVVPPVSFSQGFQITVSGKGGVFEKSTEKAVTIERNKLSKMAPIEVELTPTQPRNVIYYTSSDGAVVTPYNPDVFGANILSNEYVEGLGVITFDGDVTTIGRFAFNGCSDLTGITIPESVTSIGEAAFNRCSSLITFSGKYSSQDGLLLIDSGNNLIAVALGAINGEVTIPDGVTRIGRSALSGCSSLTSITIPESVTSIGEAAFESCSSLTEITIPKGVTSIENYAFNDCSSLTSITIPESVTTIGNWAFSWCTSLTNITIPEGVTSIGNFAFHVCSSLTNITIPEGVTTIGNNAFQTCKSLTSITIPESVTAIGISAFQNCESLTSITIPESVTTIGISAFQNCESLTSITVKPDVPPTGAGGMFNKTNNAPIYVPAGSVDAYKSAQYWSDYADRIQAIVPSYSAPVPEAIDLGLPSGLKWASFNLGASKPEEYGDYFTWGDTEPYYTLDPVTLKVTAKEGKTGFNWASYKWCMGSYNTLTKYCDNSSYGYNGFTDNKTVLDPEDDAAHVNLGGSWRIPTEEEWTELRTSGRWHFTSQNDVHGIEVTGPNGNSIFLPAAGFNFASFGSYGLYWSSSLVTDGPSCAFSMDYLALQTVRWRANIRSDGYSIRPVYAE